MYEFEIVGKQGLIRIELNEVFGFPNDTSHLGGYDVKGKIEIKSGNYYVRDADLWFSTGQVYQFFILLEKCYNELKSSITFSDAENNLKIDLNLNRFGQINIQGYFKEFADQENILQFELESRKEYLITTLHQLKNIVDQYGDLKGKK